jgi:hypothetical protein
VITYFFRFSRILPEGSGTAPVLVATGVLTVVCVGHYADGKMEAVAIPHELADKIHVAPSELLKAS